MIVLGIASLAVCSAAGAAELREVLVNIGSSSAPLIATVRIEDYRAAPIDVLAPVAASDSQMTRFLKTYYEVGRTGDIKRVASLFAPRLRDDVNDYYHTSKLLSDQFSDLRTVHVAAVLHWGEYQFGLVNHVATQEEGPREYSWAHAAYCGGGTCCITDHFQNGEEGRFVATPLGKNGSAPLELSAQGETLPILPVPADAAEKPVVTDPIVLHLNRAAEPTTAAASVLVSTLTAKLRATSPKQPSFEKLTGLYSAGVPKRVEVFQRGNELSFYDYADYANWFVNQAPWTVSAVYCLGPDHGVALLKSQQALHMLPLQRRGEGWTIFSDPSSFEPWWTLSSISTYQALQRP